MNDKTVARLAWLLCALVIVAAVATSIFNLLDQPIDGSLLEIMQTTTFFIMFIAFGVTGALIIAHQPRNIVGWLLMIEATLAFAWPLDSYFNDLPQAPAQLTLLTYLGLWIYGWMWLWFIFPILFIPLFFPTGRLLSPRWRGVVLLGLGLCLFFILFATFSTNFIQINEAWTVPNPIGFLSDDVFPDLLWSVALLSFVALSTISIFVRYRRAQRAERAQLKWLLYAAGLFAVIYTLSFLFNEMGGILGDLLGIAFGLAPLLLPIAIALAILRHRLYDIDIIIRRTLVYALLSGMLALVYFGLVILLQMLFEAISGQQSPVAIVISTLVIAALFSPLRLRIQDVIDRRFYRQKYNAQQVLERFANTARDETDVEALTAELVNVVQETMQPEKVNIWLPEVQQ